MLNSSPGAHSGVRAVQIQSMSINAGHANDPPGPDRECETGNTHDCEGGPGLEDASLGTQNWVLIYIHIMGKSKYDLSHYW